MNHAHDEPSTKEKVIVNTIMYLILIFLMTRIAFFLGGGLVMEPQPGKPEKCYSMNIFRPLVWAEAPCTDTN